MPAGAAVGAVCGMWGEGDHGRWAGFNTSTNEPHHFGQSRRNFLRNRPSNPPQASQFPSSSGPDRRLPAPRRERWLRRRRIEIRPAAPFVVDAPHEQRTVQGDRTRGKSLLVIEKARLRLVDGQRGNRPVHGMQFHPMEMVLGIGGGVSGRSQREETSRGLERGENTGLRQLSDRMAREGTCAPILPHDAQGTDESDSCDSKRLRWKMPGNTRPPSVLLNHEFVSRRGMKTPSRCSPSCFHWTAIRWAAFSDPRPSHAGTKRGRNSLNRIMQTPPTAWPL